MKLVDIQRVFYQSLYTEEVDKSLLNEIVATDKGLAAQRFAIYQNNLQENFTNALKIAYPVCFKVVGEPFFNAMVKAYIKKTPSYSPVLDCYGAEFSHFIGTYRPASSLPYLADIASLEWVWLQTFLSADQGLSNYTDFSNIDSQIVAELVFELPINATLFQSAYPILQIWEVNQPDFCGNDRVDLAQGGVKLMIWRKRWEVVLEKLSIPQWHLLTMIRQGKTLATICEGGVEKQIDIEKLLPELITRGWITGYHRFNQDIS